MSVLIVTGLLLACGLYGVLTRRDVVAVLASIEVMIGAGLVLLTGLGAWGAGDAAAAEIHGVALLLVVLAAAEAAVGLALVVAVARRMGTTRIDEMSEVKG